MGKKIGLKIPGVLVFLGRAVEVKGEHVHYYFDDNTRLLSESNGKTLWCIRSGKEYENYAKIDPLVSKHRKLVEIGLNLRDDWNDLENSPDGSRASVIKIPSGFLFEADKCHTIVYDSDKFDGKERRYIHKFKNIPTMWVNKQTEPSVLKLSGGKIRITKRGIIG